ncbi:chloramphenicol phosphotransferase CPT family protein [Pelagicoccus sp. SDUM812002]|uniref:chloramphenicol phosphotransferase CPT family protein n=1 Tax=Pelagicoccus sp. SDUM812002 TaxID=3041266 RepID=UPI0034E1F921
MIAIVLNGTSSSGKTSIVRSLQKHSQSPIVHASLDTFTDMFDWPSVREEERKECHKVGISNFHKCLPILASGRFPLVVDHVFERMEWFEECFQALKDRSVFFVGVRCPLPILEARERMRADRRTGLAKAQFDLVHVKKVYDLELDTSEMSSDDCAKLILKMITNIRANQAPQTTSASLRV